MTDEELTETIDELEARIGMLKDTVQRLNDKLHALAAPAPTLPDERILLHATARNATQGL